MLKKGEYLKCRGESTYKAMKKKRKKVEKGEDSKASQ